jgi:hypothetical protein
MGFPSSVVRFYLCGAQTTVCDGCVIERWRRSAVVISIHAPPRWAFRCVLSRHRAPAFRDHVRQLLATATGAQYVISPLHAPVGAMVVNPVEDIVVPALLFVSRNA